MKKKYLSPELEIKCLKLTAVLLEISGEISGEEGGGGIGTGDNPLPDLPEGDGL